MNLTLPVDIARPRAYLAVVNFNRWESDMRNTVEAQNLWEGAEILLSPNSGETGLVEDVSTRWAGIGAQTRTTITLVDGRTFTIRPEFPVPVLS